MLKGDYSSSDSENEPLLVSPSRIIQDSSDESSLPKNSSGSIYLEDNSTASAQPAESDDIINNFEYIAKLDEHEFENYIKSVKNLKITDPIFLALVRKIIGVDQDVVKIEEDEDLHKSLALRVSVELTRKQINQFQERFDNDKRYTAIFDACVNIIRQYKIDSSNYDKEHTDFENIIFLVTECGRSQSASSSFYWSGFAHALLEPADTFTKKLSRSVSRRFYRACFLLKCLSRHSTFDFVSPWFFVIEDVLKEKILSGRKFEKIFPLLSNLACKKLRHELHPLWASVAQAVFRGFSLGSDGEKSFLNYIHLLRGAPERKIESLPTLSNELRINSNADDNFFQLIEFMILVDHSKKVCLQALEAARVSVAGFIVNESFYGLVSLVEASFLVRNQIGGSYYGCLGKLKDTEGLFTLAPFEHLQKVSITEKDRNFFFEGLLSGIEQLGQAEGRQQLTALDSKSKIPEPSSVTFEYYIQCLQVIDQDTVITQNNKKKILQKFYSRAGNLIKDFNVEAVLESDIHSSHKAGIFAHWCSKRPLLPLSEIVRFFQMLVKNIDQKDLQGPRDVLLSKIAFPELSKELDESLSVIAGSQLDPEHKQSILNVFLIHFAKALDLTQLTLEKIYKFIDDNQLFEVVENFDDKKQEWLGRINASNLSEDDKKFLRFFARCEVGAEFMRQFNQARPFAEIFDFTRPTLKNILKFMNSMGLSKVPENFDHQKIRWIQQIRESGLSDQEKKSLLFLVQHAPRSEFMDEFKQAVFNANAQFQPQGSRQSSFQGQVIDRLRLRKALGPVITAVFSERFAQSNTILTMVKKTYSMTAVPQRELLPLILQGGSEEAYCLINLIEYFRVFGESDEQFIKRLLGYENDLEVVVAPVPVRRSLANDFFAKKNAKKNLAEFCFSGGVTNFLKIILTQQFASPGDNGKFKAGFSCYFEKTYAGKNVDGTRDQFDLVAFLVSDSFLKRFQHHSEPQIFTLLVSRHPTHCQQLGYWLSIRESQDALIKSPPMVSVFQQAFQNFQQYESSANVALILIDLLKKSIRQRWGDFEKLNQWVCSIKKPNSVFELAKNSSGLMVEPGSGRDKYIQALAGDGHTFFDPQKDVGNKDFLRAWLLTLSEDSLCFASVDGCYDFFDNLLKDIEALQKILPALAGLGDANLLGCWMSGFEERFIFKNKAMIKNAFFNAVECGSLDVLMVLERYFGGQEFVLELAERALQKYREQVDFVESWSQFSEAFNEEFLKLGDQRDVYAQLFIKILKDQQLNVLRDCFLNLLVHFTAVCHNKKLLEEFYMMQETVTFESLGRAVIVGAAVNDLAIMVKELTGIDKLTAEQVAKLASTALDVRDKTDQKEKYTAIAYYFFTDPAFDRTQCLVPIVRYGDRDLLNAWLHENGKREDLPLSEATEVAIQHQISLLEPLLTFIKNNDRDLGDGLKLWAEGGVRRLAQAPDQAASLAFLLVLIARHEVDLSSVDRPDNDLIEAYKKNYSKRQATPFVFLQAIASKDVSLVEYLDRIKGGFASLIPTHQQIALLEILSREAKIIFEAVIKQDRDSKIKICLDLLVQQGSRQQVESFFNMAWPESGLPNDYIDPVVGAARKAGLAGNITAYCAFACILPKDRRPVDDILLDKVHVGILAVAKNGKIKEALEVLMSLEPRFAKWAVAQFRTLWQIALEHKYKDDLEFILSHLFFIAAEDFNNFIKDKGVLSCDVELLKKVLRKVDDPGVADILKADADVLALLKKWNPDPESQKALKRFDGNPETVETWKGIPPLTYGAFLFSLIERRSANSFERYSQFIVHESLSQKNKACASIRWGVYSNPPTHADVALVRAITHSSLPLWEAVFAALALGMVELSPQFLSDRFNDVANKEEWVRVMLNGMAEYLQEHDNESLLNVFLECLEEAKQRGVLLSGVTAVKRLELIKKLFSNRSEKFTSNLQLLCEGLAQAHFERLLGIPGVKEDADLYGRVFSAARSNDLEFNVRFCPIEQLEDYLTGVNLGEALACALARDCDKDQAVLLVLKKMLALQVKVPVLEKRALEVLHHTTEGLTPEQVANFFQPHLQDWLKKLAALSKATPCNDTLIFALLAKRPDRSSVSGSIGAMIEESSDPALLGRVFSDPSWKAWTQFDTNPEVQKVLFQNRVILKVILSDERVRELFRDYLGKDDELLAELIKDGHAIFEALMGFETGEEKLATINPYQANAMKLAIQCDNVPAFRYFFGVYKNEGRDLYTIPMDGDVPLHVAVQYRSSAIFEAILKDCKDDVGLVENSGGKTAFDLAIESGNIAMAWRLSQRFSLSFSEEHHKTFGSMIEGREERVKAITSDRYVLERILFADSAPKFELESEEGHDAVGIVNGRYPDYNHYAHAFRDSPIDQQQFTLLSGSMIHQLARDCEQGGQALEWLLEQVPGLEGALLNGFAVLPSSTPVARYVWQEAALAGNVGFLKVLVSCQEDFSVNEEELISWLGVNFNHIPENALEGVVSTFMSNVEDEAESVHKVLSDFCGKLAGVPRAVSNEVQDLYHKLLLLVDQTIQACSRPSHRMSIAGLREAIAEGTLQTYLEQGRLSDSRFGSVKSASNLAAWIEKLSEEDPTDLLADLLHHQIKHNSKILLEACDILLGDSSPLFDKKPYKDKVIALVAIVKTYFLREKLLKFLSSDTDFWNTIDGEGGNKALHAVKKKVVAITHKFGSTVLDAEFSNERDLVLALFKTVPLRNFGLLREFVVTNNAGLQDVPKLVFVRTKEEKQAKVEVKKFGASASGPVNMNTTEERLMSFQATFLVPLIEAVQKIPNGQPCGEFARKLGLDRPAFIAQLTDTLDGSIGSGEERMENIVQNTRARLARSHSDVGAATNSAAIFSSPSSSSGAPISSKLTNT